MRSAAMLRRDEQQASCADDIVCPPTHYTNTATDTRPPPHTNNTRDANEPRKPTATRPAAMRGRRVREERETVRGARVANGE